MDKAEDNAIFSKSPYLGMLNPFAVFMIIKILTTKIGSSPNWGTNFSKLILKRVIITIAENDNCQCKKTAIAFDKLLKTATKLNS